MKTYIIDGEIPQYKTELHTHTTCSDGAYTPRELKELYLSRGFAVVAFSDHDVFVRHNDELTDEKFIALNAFELGVPSTKEDETEREKQVHLNFLAERPDIEDMPFYNPKYIYQEGAKRFIGKISCHGELEERRNDPAWLSYAIRKGNEEGFLITYNHPVWSVSAPEDYLPLDGLFAMEVWNTSGKYSAPEDGAAWRESVLNGKDLKCVAANDFHAQHGYDGMEAAVYVSTKEFSYEGIITALKKGDFYSSTGPTIQEITVSGNCLRIKCSPVEVIRVLGAKSSNLYAVASDGEFLTEATFPVRDYMRNMFYIRLEGENGAQAWTNPVFNLGKRILEGQLRSEKKEQVFLCDKTVSYPWLDDLSETVACTYFYARKIEEQIDEIAGAVEKYGFRKVYVQFSASEIIGFDYIFDIGVEELSRLQSERLVRIGKKLKVLVAWAKKKNVELVFLSMLPVPHSADVYDYRNNYVRGVNNITQKIADESGVSYVDVSSRLENGKGILAQEYEKDPTVLTRAYFMNRKGAKDNE